MAGDVPSQVRGGDVPNQVTGWQGDKSTDSLRRALRIRDSGLGLVVGRGTRGVAGLERYRFVEAPAADARSLVDGRGKCGRVEDRVEGAGQRVPIR